MAMLGYFIIRASGVCSDQTLNTHKFNVYKKMIDEQLIVERGSYLSSALGPYIPGTGI
jgi:hypothetical protein